MIYVKGIIITTGSRKLAVGYQCTLSTRIAPSDATNQTLTWRSEDSTIASVNATTGVITGKKPGTVRIYACATDGSGVEARVSITVEHAVHVTSVDVYPDTVIEAKAGDVIYHIAAYIEPTNATMRDVIWSSSNEEIATVASNGVVTTYKDGVVQITATSVEGGLSDSCTINVDSREKVTIEKDGDFNKVVFENGKVWHCINCDMIYDQDNAFNEVLTERRCLDLYEDPVNCVGYRTYTDNELVFLYTIDPCGVAKYVQMYAMQFDGLAKMLQYKDSIFKLLYKRDPKYFARNILGEWYVTNDRSNIADLLSESESIFGAHTVYDFTVGLEIAGIITSALSIALGSSFFLVNEKRKAIARVAKHIVRAISIGLSLAEGDLFSIAADSWLGEKFDNTSFYWLLDAVSLVGSVVDLAANLKSKPALYDEFVHFFVNNTNYRVRLKMANNELKEMKDLEEAMNNLQ